MHRRMRLHHGLHPPIGSTTFRFSACAERSGLCSAWSASGRPGRTMSGGGGAALRHDTQEDACPACVLLVHSSDRAEARAFWRESLVAVDRHFPLQACGNRWYFSIDDGSGAVAELTSLFGALEHAAPKPIIRARNASLAMGWVGAMRLDLSVIASEMEVSCTSPDHPRRLPRVFHLMDDTALPDPIGLSVVTAIVRLAEELSASVLGLAGAQAFWRLPGRAIQQSLPDSVRGGALGNVTMWRAHNSTRFVVHQGFALWDLRVLQRTLLPFRLTASPVQWELGWNNIRWRHSAGIGPPQTGWLQGQAYHLDFLSPTATGLESAFEVGREGFIKSGWTACSWVRAITRLGLTTSKARRARRDDLHSNESLRTLSSRITKDCKAYEGKVFLRSPHYAACHSTPPMSVGGPSERLLHQSVVCTARNCSRMSILWGTRCDECSWRCRATQTDVGAVDRQSW